MMPADADLPTYVHAHGRELFAAYTRARNEQLTPTVLAMLVDKQVASVKRAPLAKQRFILRRVYADATHL